MRKRKKEERRGKKKSKALYLLSLSLSLSRPLNDSVFFLSKKKLKNNLYLGHVELADRRGRRHGRRRRGLGVLDRDGGGLDGLMALEKRGGNGTEVRRAKCQSKKSKNLVRVSSWPKKKTPLRSKDPKNSGSDRARWSPM